MDHLPVDPAMAGRLVDVRGERWVVVSVEPYERCAVLRLEGRDAANHGDRFAVVTPFDVAVPMSPHRLSRRSRARAVEAALGSLAASRPAHGLWTATDAAIDLLPFQLEPAMAVLAGATRVPLADEVGLGKTVQAGLVLAELLARRWAHRALVLVPPGLRESWARELSTRFGLDAAVVDFQWMVDRARSMPPGANPWNIPRIAIASVDFAKRGDTLPGLGRAPFDVVIADEAHHLTPGSDRGAAVARLASQAPWVLLITATPHSGDEAAFRFLSGVGQHGDPLTVFRRTRSAAGLASGRRTRLLAVRLSRPERALARATARYARSVWRQRGRLDPAARLVAVTIARRAASSAAALHRTIARRLGLLSTTEPPPLQPLLPWDDGVIEEAPEEAGCLGAQGWHDAADERRRLRELVRLTIHARPGASKIRCLDRFIARAREPVVVFTEFRDTLQAVVDALAVRHRVAALHGGLLPAERTAVLERFATGGADVLVATDAAGEGLNLHHRCRLVVTMELPWNPVRLEQRVGRVDRIGQAKSVRALHLYHRGTVEDTVLARLERRRARAGAAMAVESQVADAVFDRRPIGAVEVTFPASSRIASAWEEAGRLTRARTWRHSARAVPATAVWAAPRRCGAPCRRVLLLHEAQLLDERGRLVEQSHVAIAVEIAAPFLDRQEWLTLIRQVEADERTGNAVHLYCECRAGEIDTRQQAARRQVAARLARIERVRAAALPTLVQDALFDRRSRRERDHAKDDAARLADHLRRCGPGAVPRSPGRWHVRLVAAFPLAR